MQGDCKEKFLNGPDENAGMSDLVEWLGVEKWAPITDVIGYSEGEIVSKYLYKFNERVYLLLSDFSGPNFRDGNGAKYVTAVGFCGGEGAARRAFNGEIEADDGTTLRIEDIIIGLKDAKYLSILEFARNNQSRIVQETASYRIARDGAFIHRKIETEKWIFYFRQPDNNFDEIAYAFMNKMV